MYSKHCYVLAAVQASFPLLLNIQLGVSHLLYLGEPGEVYG